MKCELHDHNRTFGIELEGIINGHSNEDYDDEINTREEGCYCECEEGCTGECTGECYCSDMCECEELREDFIMNSEEGLKATEDEIDKIECDYCKGEAQCTYCLGECECSYCREECDCDSCQGYCECSVCMGRCESCLEDYRNNYCSEDNRYQLAEYIRNKTGVDCQAEGWSYKRVCSYWSIITDSSIHCGEGEQDIEVKSPILKGLEGLEEVKKVVQAMQEYGVKVNSSTGLHVHHCARDLKPKAFTNLVKLYSFYEGVIDSMLPRSRRGNQNGMISSVNSTFNSDSSEALCSYIEEEVETEEILNTENRFAHSLLADKSSSDRYCKLNIMAFNKYKTVEFRHHSGTVDYKKVIAWIELTQNFINYCNKNRTRIQKNHVPSFIKLMLITKTRPEVREHYTNRRIKFNEQYNSFTAHCANYKTRG